MENTRRRRPYVMAAFVGLLYGVIPILADRGSWTAWSWRTDAARVWQLVGGLFAGPSERGLHTLDLLAIREGFLVFTDLPRAIAADLLQQVVGGAGSLFGLGGDRYEAFSRMVEGLGPAGSLWLWLATTALVGVLLALLVLTIVRAGGRGLAAARIRRRAQ